MSQPEQTHPKAVKHPRHPAPVYGQGMAAQPKPRSRCMLSSIPEVTEQQAKGKPPVGSARIVIHRGSQFPNFSGLRLEAFACSHLTRDDSFGQCTEGQRATGAA